MGPGGQGGGQIKTGQVHPAGLPLSVLLQRSGQHGENVLIGTCCMPGPVLTAEERNEQDTGPTASQSFIYSCIQFNIHLLSTHCIPCSRNWGNTSSKCVPTLQKFRFSLTHPFSLTFMDRLHGCQTLCCVTRTQTLGTVTALGLIHPFISSFTWYNEHLLSACCVPGTQIRGDHCP